MADFTPHHHHPIATANGYSRRREPRRKNHYSAGGGVILRRCIRCWVVVPPVYVLGLIVCACTVSIILYDSSRVPGSVYRSHDVFLKVWDEIRSDNSTPIELSTIWRHKKLKNQKGCEFTPTRQDAIAHSGYLIVEANGGLNQQRSSICNAVAVAGILNATLLVPHFEYHNVWQDRSEFGDIYDKDHFISTLDGFVKVVPELPRTLLEQYDYNISNVPVTQVRAWAPVSYYLEEIYPILQNQGLVRIAPFANRLAMSVPPHIQFLRCLANYKALRFALPISTLAKKIIDQMMEKSSRSDGKYVSVHLRFEEDMIAFSGCVYEGGRREQFEMDVVRERGWRDKFRRRGRKINPGLNRLNGKCPLTPVEVGMMLRGMGFGNDTSIYLASGKLYKEERHLAPLLQIFPLLYTKESLATPEELAPLKAYSSRMAAVDYGVCLFSEVFLTTQGGNFPHFLMGHRRFLYGGHAKTINPNKLKLVPLFKDTNISWTDIKEQVTPMLDESNREGRAEAIISKSNRKTSVYKHPFPACRCLEGAQNLTLSRTHVHDLLDHQLFSVI